MRFCFSRSVLCATAVCGAVVFSATGCAPKKPDFSGGLTTAINTYYAAHPGCLWQQPIKFPLQVDTSDASKTAPYDALVDQGLLARTTAEKKKLIVSSKQVNNYDLSDKGHSIWIADPSQPGFGNFCYGHRKVSGIDSYTPTDGDVGASSVVEYHYTITDAPSWATAPETETAYPRMQAKLTGPQTGEATLMKTSDGWQITKTEDPPIQMAPATPADGKIVQ